MNCWQYRGRYVDQHHEYHYVDYWSIDRSILNLYSTCTQPVLDRVSTDTWPNIDRYISRGPHKIHDPTRAMGLPVIVK